MSKMFLLQNGIFAGTNDHIDTSDEFDLGIFTTFQKPKEIIDELTKDWKNKQVYEEENSYCVLIETKDERCNYEEQEWYEIIQFEVDKYYPNGLDD